MDDFFKTIYDHAVETDALTHENNRQYHEAHTRLHELLEHSPLDTAAQNELLYAVYDLLYHSDIDALVYGFRLAVEVIRPICPRHPAPAWTARRSCCACP